MGFLLDTHVILWTLQGNRELDAACCALIADMTNEVFYSLASVWEICIKVSRGNLKIPDDLEAALEKVPLSQLPFTFEHALEFRALPYHHRDPFDRMLIAQARIEKLTLVTHDPIEGPQLRAPHGVRTRLDYVIK